MFTQVHDPLRPTQAFTDREATYAEQPQHQTELPPL